MSSIFSHSFSLPARITAKAEERVQCPCYNGIAECSALRFVHLLPASCTGVALPEVLVDGQLAAFLLIGLLFSYLPLWLHFQVDLKDKYRNLEKYNKL